MTIANPVTTIPVHVALDEMEGATSLGAAMASLERAILGLGFQHFAALDRHRDNGVKTIHSNAPAAWSGSPEALEQHPTVRRAMATPIPFTWDRQMFLAAGADALWSRQAALGFATGVCAAYGPADARACIVVAGKAGGSIAAAEQMQHYGNLLLLAGATFAAFNRLSPAEPALPTVKLRPRELECLHWILRSKTAWEIGQILGIAERTVNQHLARARQQLDASNTAMAATRAVQLQLLPRPYAA